MHWWHSLLNNELHHTNRYHCHRTVLIGPSVPALWDSTSFTAPFLSKLCHYWNFVITQTNKCVMNKYICSKQWVICSNICPIVVPHRGLPRLMGRTNNFNNLNTDKMLVLQRIHLHAKKAVQLNLWFLWKNELVVASFSKLPVSEDLFLWISVYLKLKCDIWTAY